MAEEMISKERIDYTIDLLITMAVEEIAEDTGKSPKEILPGEYPKVCVNLQTDVR